MVSDSELVNRLREIIRGSDLNTTTAGGVRRRLVEEFSVDFHERRHFIREQIDIFLQELRESQNGELEEEENGEAQEDEKSEEEEEEEERSSEDSLNLSRLSCCFYNVLLELLGVPELARTEVVKKIWAYIREKNLQNPKDKRKILCDERLRGIFRVRSIDMFKMNKALSKHIWPLDEVQGPNEMDKHVKKKGGGFTKPCALSPQLQEFLGVPELARTGVVKRLWAYIREKNLQNPKNKRKILCDEALHGIFRVRSIDMFQMNKALSKHIWPLNEAEATPVKSSQKKRQRESREEDLDQPKRKEKLQKGRGSI
ncbi:SWIB complex BAF60b domain-containing protein [Abeliophyllum distichum]|uniref:SWIB complex BAF60b domain-containing protein n=1 Tax=Abeliophyllum distichum TaxID=126358 RepID=A0ABD1P8L0_9LAMI